MKSFEQIAKAMYQLSWETLPQDQQGPWIAAAREAAEQLAQVH